MQIETITLDAIIPYARNSRTHSDEQIAQIAASIREFGFTNPVLIDADGGIIAGHGRVMAARNLGMGEVPCIRLAHLTEAQKRAYVIADNKLALNAGWDDEMLALELRDLQDMDFDLSLTGFEAGDIDALLAGLDATPEGKTDPDAAPPVQAEAVTKPGDVWVLGNHRVMCGDSTDADHLEVLIDGGAWDVCVFDPPYDTESLYVDAMPAALPGRKLLVFWDFKRFAIAGHAAIHLGWCPQYELIWDNVTSWYTPNRPLARHKACGVFGDDPRWDFDRAIIRDGKVREQKRVSNTRGEYEYKPLDGAVHLRTVEAFPTTSESGGHSHSKPLAWVEAIFNGVCGNVYFDAFGGSGTTLIACEMSGRISRSMEIDPKYCDVIVRRWQQFTGKTATLESTGEPFPG